MPPEPIFGEPVLQVDDALAIADVHIGVEKEFIHAGAAVPSVVDEFLERLTSLASARGATTLLILGDLKHTIGYSTRWERREVPRFLEGLQGIFAEVHVVPGNHDAGLRDLVPDGVDLHPATGAVHGDCGFAHGHRWPSEEVMAAEVLAVGHNHPVVAFEDALGKVTHQRCWIRTAFREEHPRYPRLPEELIKLPAFNPLLGGAPVNSRSRRLRGPLMRPDVADLDGARVFLEDGTFMGQVADLPRVPSRRSRRRGKSEKRRRR